MRQHARLAEPMAMSGTAAAVLNVRHFHLLKINRKPYDLLCWRCVIFLPSKITDLILCSSVTACMVGDVVNTEAKCTMCSSQRWVSGECQGKKRSFQICSFFKEVIGYCSKNYI